MAYFTYDTSVIISRRSIDLRIKRSHFLLSTVVLMELMASSKDDAQRRIYEYLSQDYQQDDSLIIPNDADWLFAGKILFWLTRRRRRAAGGRLRPLEPGMSQRMAMDALLATSAKRREATIVTANWDDFKAIQHFCDVKLIKASDFFN